MHGEVGGVWKDAGVVQCNVCTRNDWRKSQEILL